MKPRLTEVSIEKDSVTDLPALCVSFDNGARGKVLIIPPDGGVESISRAFHKMGDMIAHEPCFKEEPIPHPVFSTY